MIDATAPLTKTYNALSSNTELAINPNPTFENITTASADVTSIITAASAGIANFTAGQITCNSGYLQTPTLKLPGTTANDIQNSTGSEAARFYNDYRCRFNGNTTILGDASVSGELYSAGTVTRNQTMKVVEDATTHGARSNFVSSFINKQVNGFFIIIFLATLTQQKYQRKQVKYGVVEIVVYTLVRLLHTL